MKQLMSVILVSSSNWMIIHHDGTSKNFRSMMTYFVTGSLLSNDRAQFAAPLEFFDSPHHTGAELMRLLNKSWTSVREWQAYLGFKQSPLFHLRGSCLDTDNANTGERTGFWKRFQDARTSAFDCLRAGMSYDEAVEVFQFTNVINIGCIDHVLNLVHKDFPEVLGEVLKNELREVALPSKEKEDHSQEVMGEDMEEDWWEGAVGEPVGSAGARKEAPVATMVSDTVISAIRAVNTVVRGKNKAAFFFLNYA